MAPFCPRCGDPHDIICPGGDLGLRNAVHFAALGQVVALSELRKRLDRLSVDRPGVVDAIVFLEIETLTLELAGNAPGRTEPQ